MKPKTKVPKTFYTLLQRNRDSKAFGPTPVFRKPSAVADRDALSRFKETPTRSQRSQRSSSQTPFGPMPPIGAKVPTGPVGVKSSIPLPLLPLSTPFPLSKTAAKMRVKAAAVAEAKRLEQLYRRIALLKCAFHQRRLRIPSRKLRRLFHHFIRFGQWLAGVIDGDGYFYETKDGYTVGLSITMGTEDRPLLEYIKRMLGGGGILRKGSENAWQYQVGKRSVMLRLTHVVSGYICSSVRQPQFKRVCRRLEVSFQKPFRLTRYSAHTGGFFDADGSTSLYSNKARWGYPVPQISITNKYRENLEHLSKLFGGRIYFRTDLRGDKTFGWYRWLIQSRKDIERFLAYYHSYPSYPFPPFFRSRKSKRLSLLPELYRLRDKKAYQVDSPFHPEWLAFRREWNFEEKALLVLLSGKGGGVPTHNNHCSLAGLVPDPPIYLP